MKAELSRDRVYGFLKAQGMEIRNERNEPVQLLGWGLGNWLLCEGYMWQLGDFPAFDRPRRIEESIRQLTGEKYAERFWRQFRESYIAEKDLEMMARMGYNSLRVPINSRLFLEEEGEGIQFREEGFQYLDWLMDACEKHKLYVWIDLHGAPGGQTGANIDDSPEDLCGLLMEEKHFERGVALWEEVARRYHDRWIVAGYDLLNEPLRPVRFPGDVPLEEYEPRLREFYDAAVSAIRRNDTRHLIAIEGKHWASDLSLFDRKYDYQMVLHFHRYWCAPELKELQDYIDAARRLNVPLWLGETGENTLEWYSAMIPLALELGIHVTMWPWKKMDTDNSPCSYAPPRQWGLIRAWLAGGVKPGEETAQGIFDELLENIQVGRCRSHGRIAAYLTRTPECEVRGVDFDEPKLRPESCHAEGAYAPGLYREDTGMEIIQPEGGDKDAPWKTTLLRLHAGEWAQYTFQDVTSSCLAEVGVTAEEPARVAVYQGERLVGEFEISACRQEQILAGMHLYTEDQATLKVVATEGTVCVHRVGLRLARAI